MTEHTLNITWTVSRGRNTYGYHVVTLCERGEVKARCNGGGYDMRGTVFAEWLENAFQERLLKIGSRLSYQVNKKGERSRNEAKNHLYGGTFNRQKNKVTLDGGCGFSSIERIAEAIGLKVRLIDASKGTDIVLVSDSKAAEE